MIYLDNAATTKICDKSNEAMKNFLEDNYGNPSANYDLGRKSKRAIDNARYKIANILSTKKENIIFTSGGTESDNTVIMNMLNMDGGNGQPPHIITSKIEHPAILNACKYVEERNVEVTYLNVNRNGEINLDELESHIKSNTRLISIMYANNEIGTIEPIAKIGRIARSYGILFHTDAVQAFGHVPINVNSMNIDFLSASAHKFNGPKGVGFLYVRDKSILFPLIYGGGQEDGMRSGTENVASIVGMEAAATQAVYKMQKRYNKERMLRNYFFDKITRQIPDVIINGHKINRLPGNINISIKGANAKYIVDQMNERGICISAGSACAAIGGKPSHVISAIGVPLEYAYGTIRITLSFENTKEEIDKIITILMEILRNS